MNKNLILRTFVLLFLLTIGISCKTHKTGFVVNVTNPCEIPRNSETIEVWLNKLKDFPVENSRQLRVFDKNGKEYLTQLIDSNSDSIPDILLFQADFEAKECKSFHLTTDKKQALISAKNKKAFCRFIPERIDDFAWENDKVAFRAYGPECQKLFENGNPAGLISSGIDCWLKRVEYPIINKWYKKDKQGGSYHEDDGEGLDNYHVGTTRGCGGTALLANNNYLLSDNFSNWKIIANGPMRAIFELTYPEMIVEKESVSEKKIISIDLGSNFYKATVIYQSQKPIKQAAIGIAHHQTTGEPVFDNSLAFLSYWEKLDDSFLGTAIILDKNTVTQPEHFRDDKNNWINVSLDSNTFSYYAGFGWKKSGQFTSVEQWNTFVKNQSILKNNPVLVQIENQ